MVYMIGFFLDWPFNIESSWIPAMIGAVIIAIGAVCGLLWLVDPAEGEHEEDDGA